MDITPPHFVGVILKTNSLSLNKKTMKKPVIQKLEETALYKSWTKGGIIHKTESLWDASTPEMKTAWLLIEHEVVDEASGHFNEYSILRFFPMLKDKRWCVSCDVSGDAKKCMKYLLDNIK